MTKKHATPKARRDAEATLRATLRAMKEELGETCLTWGDGVVSGDSLDDAIKALHKRAGTESVPMPSLQWLAFTQSEDEK